jgi:CRISPR-associated protein (TIGR02710 family)
MLVAQNPWNALGYQAIEDACLLFDQCAFMPAASRLNDARKAVDDESVKRSLSTFHQLCEGYGFWDRFQHKDAIQRIANVLKNANDIQVAIGSHCYEVVVRSIKRDHQTLQEIVAQPRSRAMIADLLANALRRKQEARYDDGVARLYRAIESLAQLALAERHGISSTDEVPLERVPEATRGYWALHAENGKLRLGLQDAFAVLNEFGDQTGKAFKALGLHDPQRSPLMARNQSILAHGFQPVGTNVFDQLWCAAMSLGGFLDNELPKFPHFASPDAVA